jgi:predicted nucleic acid-binding protein
MNADPEVIVINTGPLILLGKINALDIAGQLPVSFISPPAVREELDNGAEVGHLKITPLWLEIRNLRSPISPMVEMSLDRGEAAVIQLALDYGIQDVCIDDLRGRNMAKVIGLRVSGLLGLLARAKLLGIIPQLAPLTEKLLKSGGRYSPKLIRTFLAKYGE